MRTINRHNATPARDTPIESRLGFDRQREPKINTAGDTSAHHPSRPVRIGGRRSRAITCTATTRSAATPATTCRGRGLIGGTYVASASRSAGPGSASAALIVRRARSESLPDDQPTRTINGRNATLGEIGQTTDRPRAHWNRGRRARTVNWRNTRASAHRTPRSNRVGSRPTQVIACSVASHRGDASATTCRRHRPTDGRPTLTINTYDAGLDSIGRMPTRLRARQDRNRRERTINGRNAALSVMDQPTNHTRAHWNRSRRGRTVNWRSTTRDSSAHTIVYPDPAGLVVR